MTWTCDQVEARLSDYLEGLLQAPERVEFEAHMHKCAECAPLVEGVRTLISEMQSVEQLEVSPVLINSILDKTIGPQEHVSFWQSVKSFLGGLATPKFAYGFASVAATLFIVLSAAGLSLRKPKLADLNPSTMSHNISRKMHQSYANAEKYVTNLRVVYEIQSRLRQTDNQLQNLPEETTPKSNREGKPGDDDHTRTQPRQQNRADEFLVRQAELLAAECPVMIERSFR
jgi:anti-sigma-K factor RskA